MKTPQIIITKEILKLIAGIDEFKGQWQAIGNLAPDRLEALKGVFVYSHEIFEKR